MNKKETTVLITGDAKEEFDRLNKLVKEELLKGIPNSDKQILLRSIQQKIDFLKNNSHKGIQIAKRKIPKEYIVKYDATNLWKLNLSSAWRMIYTIQGDEVEIISIILDIIDHKVYNKKFKYKKS